MEGGTLPNHSVLSAVVKLYYLIQDRSPNQFLKEPELLGLAISF